MPKVELRLIEVGGTDYALALELRCRVLLDPFDIDPELARVEDEHATHFAAFERQPAPEQAGAGVQRKAQQGRKMKDRCVGTLLLVPREGGVLQMRQVAVAADRQRRGLGRALVQQAEFWGREHAFRSMMAHARWHAVPFYQALDYRLVGAEYVEVGIRHRTVNKDLRCHREARPGGV